MTWLTWLLDKATRWLYRDDETLIDSLRRQLEYYEMKTEVNRVLDGFCGLHPVKARWLYASREPLTLVMQIVSKHGPVTWVVSRDLLRDGLKAPAGIGDVHVEMDESTNSLILALTTDKGHAALAFDATAISDLLDATSTVVPFGMERIDWDTELARVIG